MDRDLKVSQRLFFLGFLGLPIFWFFNILTFYPKWSILDGEVKRYIKRSTFGLVLALVAIVTWAVIFQIDPDYWREIYPNLVITSQRPKDPWDAENL